MQLGATAHMLLWFVFVPAVVLGIGAFYGTGYYEAAGIPWTADYPRFRRWGVHVPMTTVWWAGVPLLTIGLAGLVGIFLTHNWAGPRRALGSTNAPLHQDDSKLDQDGRPS